MFDKLLSADPKMYGNFYVVFVLQTHKINNKKVCTEGPLLTLFFETLEKQPCIVSRKPCKQRSDLVLNGQMRVPK